MFKLPFEQSAELESLIDTLPFEESAELEKLIEAYAFGQHHDDDDDEDAFSSGQHHDHADDEDYAPQHHHDHADDEASALGQHHDYGNDDDDDADHADVGENEDEDEFVEVDPTNRYGRYPDLLGTGAIKKVYRGFDKEEGIEVAWNQVNLHALTHVESEVHFLETLKHKNIIKIYKFWVDRRRHKINFITELCSDTLWGFRRHHRHVCMKAVKDWARQILRALVYLHSQNPPIIHRDLKCENIFVNCCSGKIKVGDFGSATLLDETRHLHSLVGTPEFMAPEMYMEDYNELVDVYAFGMCMIELLTVEMPYKECKNLLQIYRKVTEGLKPKALDKVKDVEALRFIRKCLAPISQRPSAADLLSDPFLLCERQVQPGMDNTFYPGRDPILMKSASSPNLERVCMLPSEEKPAQDKKSLTSHGSFDRGRNQREIKVTGKLENESKFLMRLRIVQPNNYFPVRNVKFSFDSNSDTPQSVAKEMVQELDFPESDSAVIADLIAVVISSFKQGKENAMPEGALEASHVELGSQISSYLKAIA